MKGIKENLPPGRKASNARMREACTNMTKRIMGDTTAARWLKKHYRVLKVKEEQVKVGRLKSFLNRLFRRV